LRVTIRKKRLYNPESLVQVTTERKPSAMKNCAPLFWLCLLALLVASVAGVSFHPTEERDDESSCVWRGLNTTQLDTAFLIYDLQGMRVQIQQALATLEELYEAVDVGGLLNLDCLYPLRTFLTSPANLEGLRSCSAAIVSTLQDIQQTISPTSK